MAHGFEADHLAAVTMLHAEAGGHNAANNTPNNKDKGRNKLRNFFAMRATTRATTWAMTWALGHGVMLLLASFVLWYFFKNQDIAQKLGPRFDLGVGVAMVGLAIYYIFKMRGASLHLHRHRHDNVTHVHVHSHKKSTRHHHGHSPAIFALGMLQGLAGSADVVVLGLLSTTSTTAQWFFALVVFSLGVMVGIVFLSLVINRHVQWMQQHFATAHRLFGYASCLLAMVIGARLIYNGW